MELNEELKPREKKKLENRRKMIEAATVLFSSRPYAEVSMREIAKLVDVSPALIYKYFDDQSLLFLEVFKKESEKLMDSLSREFHESPPPLGELAYYYIDYMFEHDTLYQIMSYFMLEQNKHAELYEGIEMVTNELLSTFEKAVAGFVKVEDSRRHAQLLFSSLNGLLITYKNYPNRSNKEVQVHIHQLLELLIDQIKKQR